MSAEAWLGLVGVFLGGALPWLEAVVVIPAGILAGLPALPVIVAGAVGNLITVGIAAYGGEWLIGKWSDWRRRRKAASGEGNNSEAEAALARRSAKNRARIERLMNRGGLPLLALVGPLGLGTQVSAVVAVSTGVRATVSLIWIGAGTVVWCVIAGMAAVTGFQFLGIGA